MSRRSLQVGSAVQRAVQDVLARGLEDPRITGLVTVVGVDLTDDLRRATVRVSVMPEQAASLTLHGLRSAEAHVRRQVARRVCLRNVPEIVFTLDRGMMNQASVLRALNDAGIVHEVQADDSGAVDPAPEGVDP